MGNLFAKYETDPSKEAEGVRVPVDDCVFICRRAGGNNRLYSFAVSAALMKHRDRLDSKDGRIMAEAEADVTVDAYTETVVIGWENVTDRAGNPWPFSKENFKELMRACPDVWTQIRMEARDIDNFRLEQVAAVSEELGKSSSGMTSGENTSSA